ncbi:MAG: OmpA family protein [Rhizobiaceae bacterium]|nr:OmpA family protein [Rhizobiaceae bacterium]
MRATLLAATILAAALSPAAAGGSAQPEATAGASIDPVTTSGICVGTPAECAARLKVELEAAPSGLDMQVQFELNSAELTRQARFELGELAKAMNDSQLAGSSFLIEGHTDASGTEAYNRDLSLRRARSVETFLLQSGVEASRLQALGLGEIRPRVPNPYDPANRRVEMRVKTQ